MHIYQIIKFYFNHLNITKLFYVSGIALYIYKKRPHFT